VGDDQLQQTKINSKTISHPKTESEWENEASKSMFARITREEPLEVLPGTDQMRLQVHGAGALKS
jgi:hypothetical protein